MSAALTLPRPKRRLIVPAERTEARETLVTAAPFFLRAGADSTPAAPPLLSFDGADFVDDLMAAIADPAKWPKLLPWRDWAEPPQSVLDANGAARYPAGVARAAPRPDMIERDPDVATADGVPAATPPWLRKLYLPLHLRFTFVAFDVACQRAGWPRLARARVLGSGAVVRRLRPNGAAAAPGWEDWISADGKRGIWIALAQPIEARDPEALTASAYAGIETTVRSRLGLGAAPPLPAALDSARLTLLPPDAGNGAAAKHSTLYGYVPVFSAAEQATEFAGADTATLTTELKAKALAAANAAATTAPALRARMQPALSTLLGLTVLPANEPSASDLDTAINTVASFTRPPVFPNPQITGDPAFVRAAIDDATRAVLRLGWAALAPPPDLPATGLAAFADPGTADAWFDAARSGLPGPLIDPGGLTGEWLRASFSVRANAWRIIIAKRVHQLADAVLTGAALGPSTAGAALRLDDTDRLLLLACAILRLRRIRMALVVSLRQQMFGSADPATLRAMRNGIPQVTAGALGQEIAASIGLEDWRGTDIAPSWPPLATDAPHGSNSQAAMQAHTAAQAIEDAYADFEAAGAEAGSVFETEQDSQLATANTALLGRLGVADPAGQRYQVLRAQGLEPLEQPARGLFALPGPAPDTAVLTAAATTIANRFTAATALTESRDTARVHRLRYDHDSLYAIHCWVRVAGRDACEKPRVIWTQSTEPFAIAEPTDVLGAKPATIQLPDIPRLIRDIPRIAKAKARPFAAFAAPPNSSYVTSDDPKDTKQAWGIGFICSFGIPVITICAYILFSIILSILIILPSFTWMLLLKFCIPIPVPKKS